MIKRSLLKWIVLGTFVVSCSKNEKSPLNENGNPIIGDHYSDENMNFPGGVPVFVALIRLNSPALLNSAKKEASGQYSVDMDLKDSLLEEQEEAIEKLKAISPDIKFLYKYRMVLNALAIQAPQSVASQINQLKLGFIESNEPFRSRHFHSQGHSPSAHNNVASLIGADKIHKYFKGVSSNGDLVPIKGQGIRVGVADTGIDFTHRTFGGAGDPAVYNSIDPSKDTAFFPNNKVKGGKDFVGESFSMESGSYEDQIPVPDNNPIDTNGHGTAVASILAGKGDNVNTYDGVAPEAELYALKISSKSGSSTMVFLASLEYAADPNADFSLQDRLHIVNFSLESPSGRPQSLYNQAIANLTKAGVMVVAAAGNQGFEEPNVVGSPGTADHAISVAASVSTYKENDMPAIKFQSPNHPLLLTKFREGEEDMTIPVSQLPSGLTGKLVHIGLANKDLSQEQKDQVKGCVALIDRGEVSFSEKIGRAYEAGAIGVVIINNVEGHFNAPIRGDKSYPVPGVFITSDIGKILKENLEQGVVDVDFKPIEGIERPEVIDAMAAFSSRGPRSIDSLIKPEITAPGVKNHSAKWGTGYEGIKQDGTSFSSPIVSGVLALLLQYKKNLSPAQAKSMILNTGSLINNPEEEGLYPISRQGAGRLNAYRALTTDIVSSRPTISLGHISVDDQMTLVENFQVQNLADHQVTYTFDPVNSDTMKLFLSKTQVNLASGEKKDITVSIQLKARDEIVAEANAFIKISKGTQFMGFIPILAIISKSTNINLDQLLIDAPNLSSSMGQNVEVTLSNESPNKGSAFLFNLLGRDSRNLSSDHASASHGCDLQSSGYRLVYRDGKKFLQLAVKLFNPVSNWKTCTVTAEIDYNGDLVTDEWLRGAYVKEVPWLKEINHPDFKFGTLVFDMHKYLKLQQNRVSGQELLVGSYKSLSRMYAFPHSTISIVEIPVNRFGNLDIRLKIYVSFKGIDTFKRDILSSESTTNFWQKISLNPEKSGYRDIPMEVELEPGASKKIRIKKGLNRKEALIGYFPRNFFTTGYGQDNQSFIPGPVFKNR